MRRASCEDYCAGAGTWFRKCSRLGRVVGRVGCPIDSGLPVRTLGACHLPKAAALPPAGHQALLLPLLDKLEELSTFRCKVLTAAMKEGSGRGEPAGRNSGVEMSDRAAQWLLGFY